MSDISKEELKEIVNTAVENVTKTFGTMDKATHADHHQFIKELIDERRRKTIFKSKIKEQVVGWGIVVFLGAVGTFVWHAVMDALKAIK